MKNLLSLGLACSLLLSPNCMSAEPGSTTNSKKVSAVEYLYADVSDANSILGTIDSGLLSTYQGKNRAAWEHLYREKRATLAKQLARLPSSGLSANDTAAIAAMRKQMKAFTGGGALFSPPAKCKDAARKVIAYPMLKSALVACFVEIGNSLSFEGNKINRVSALDLLHETSDPSRRKAVFFAFVPLWQAINGNNEPDSVQVIVEGRRRRLSSTHQAQTNGQGGNTEPVQSLIVLQVARFVDGSDASPAETHQQELKPVEGACSPALALHRRALHGAISSPASAATSTSAMSAQFSEFFSVGAHRFT